MIDVHARLTSRLMDLTIIAYNFFVIEGLVINVKRLAARIFLGLRHCLWLKSIVHQPDFVLKRIIIFYE